MSGEAGAAPSRANALTLMDQRMIASMVLRMAKEFGPSIDQARLTADFSRAMEIDARFCRQIRDLAKRLPPEGPTRSVKISSAPLAPTAADRADAVPAASWSPPLVWEGERPVFSVELEQSVKLGDWLAIAAPALATMLVLGLGPLSIMLR